MALYIIYPHAVYIKVYRSINNSLLTGHKIGDVIKVLPYKTLTIPMLEYIFNIH